MASQAQIEQIIRMLRDLAPAASTSQPPAPSTDTQAEPQEQQPEEQQQQQQGLSSEAIVGIVVAVLALVGVIIGAIVAAINSRKQKQTTERHQAAVSQLLGTTPTTEPASS